MATESMPLITVIVAVLNGASTLQRCIDSVAEQTYPNKELVIMDGGSTDGTIEVLKANSDKITYWESRLDRGVSHAWNKALDHAKGEWIIFIGSDDYLWTPEVLTQMVPHLIEAFPPHRVVYGQLAVTTEEGRILQIKGKPWEEEKPRFPHMMHLPHASMFFNRSLFEVHGGFDEAFSIAPDYELLLRESTVADFIFVPDVIVTGVQYGGLSTTPALAVKTTAEIRRAQIKNGVSRVPSLEWVRTYVKAWVKYRLYSLLGEKMSRVCIDVYRTLTGRRSRGL